MVMDFNSKVEDMELMLKRSLLSRSKLATISKDLEGVTQYICVVCNEQYDDKEELQVHLFSHFKEYRFICSICGTGLKRREHLDRHMQGHMEVRPYPCEECGKAFKRREHLNIHKSIHKGVKTLQCSLCSKCFYRKDHLQKHIQTHNKHFMEQNIIPMSDQELNIKEELEDDFEDIKPIITSVSGNVTDPDASMESEEYGSDQQQSMDESTEQTEEHTVTLNHAKNARPFVCSTCGKSYKRKDHLKIHSWTHAKKEVMCKLCGKEFHMKEQLLVHVNMIHLKSHENTNLSQLQTLLGSDIEVEILNNDHLVPRKMKEERAHECPICHRKFKRKQHLKVHANVHLKKNRTYFCNVCHEGFHDDTDHANHVCPGLIKNESEEGDDEYTQNEEDGDASYEQTSSNGDARKENYPHDLLEVVVEETVIPTPQRVFVCKYCGKAFRRKDHYKIHLHIHTGHKSFFCPTCDKGFYRKDHLQKHMIVHAKSKLKLPTKSQKVVQELRPPPPFDGPLRQQPARKKKLPDLLPIAIKKEETRNGTEKKTLLPEITIHAPSSAKIRVPLQIKVPYQMVMSMDNGEQRAVTVDPTDVHEPEEDTEENILPD